MADGTFRLRALWAVALLSFALLWIRLFTMQVVDHGYYAGIAHDNRVQLSVDIARRGLLRDRNGRILAQNDPSYSVYLMRNKVQSAQNVVGHLARILNRDSTEIMQKLKDSRVPPFEAVRIARHVPLEVVCAIEEQNERVPGVLLRYENTRRYPEPAGGSHLLGYVTEASGDSDQPGVHAGSFVGVRGAEQQFDGYLRGIDGEIYMDVTAGGQVVGKSKDNPTIPSRPGADVELTLDWGLQTFATEALAKRGIGSVVCMDPRNGDVLALVNNPGFDPNLFSGTLPAEVWEQISKDTTHPFLDRAIRGLYPPGSTTKLITAGAGLEQEIVGPNTRFSPCNGGLQFGNRFFRCWKAEGHGSLNLVEAIAQSCDVYFYQLAEKLGVNTWADYARMSGLGLATGIDLPGEKDGLVPDSAYYDQRYGRRGWTRTLAINLGIGQGELLCTPLQLAAFFCALANDGVAMTPRVLRTLRMPTGEEFSHPSSVAYRLPYSREHLSLLQLATRTVVDGKKGTAKVVNFPDLDVAGKTGTAQNPHGDNHAWFACYAPYSAPEIVVVALVENSGQGSEIAAPLCGEVLRYYFGLPPIEVPEVQPVPEAPDTTTPGVVMGPGDLTRSDVAGAPEDR
jgi:penicillin-binding protein 2